MMACWAGVVVVEDVARDRHQEQEQREHREHPEVAHHRGQQGHLVLAGLLQHGPAERDRRDPHLLAVDPPQGLVPRVAGGWRGSGLGDRHHGVGAVVDGLVLGRRRRFVLAQRHRFERTGEPSGDRVAPAGGVTAGPVAEDDRRTEGATGAAVDHSR